MKSTEFMPGNNKILVELIETEENNNGLVVESTTGTQYGKVVNTGYVSDMNQTTIPLGATVYLGKLGGTDVTLEDGQFKVYRNDEILGYCLS